MTPEPTFCLADDSVIDAACLMRDEHIGVVPIVKSEERRRLVGIVTDRDLCRRAEQAARGVEEGRVNDEGPAGATGWPFVVRGACA